MEKDVLNKPQFVDHIQEHLLLVNLLKDRMELKIVGVLMKLRVLVLINNVFIILQLQQTLIVKPLCLELKQLINLYV